MLSRHGKVIQTAKPHTVKRAKTTFPFALQFTLDYYKTPFATKSNQRKINARVAQE